MKIQNKISKFPTFISHIVLQTVNKIIKITIQIYVCKQHNFLIQLTQPGVMFLMMLFSILLKVT